MADQGFGDLAEVVDHLEELLGAEARPLQTPAKRLQRGHLDAFDHLVAERAWGAILRVISEVAKFIELGPGKWLEEK